MRALAIVMLCGATAQAMPQGGGWLHYELAGMHVRGDETTVDAIVLAGARLHGFVGGKWLAYHGGLALAAGSTVGRAGLAYDVALMPLGGALRLGDTGVIALATGVAASGAVGTLDDAVLLPLELTAEFGAGPVRVLARGRASWSAGARERNEGAPSTSLADELDAMLAIRLGTRERRFGFDSGDGYFAGVAFRELAGARFVGVVIGFSIDGASVRRSRNAWEGCETCD